MEDAENKRIEILKIIDGIFDGSIRIKSKDDFDMKAFHEKFLARAKKRIDAVEKKDPVKAKELRDRLNPIDKPFDQIEVE